MAIGDILRDIGGGLERGLKATGEVAKTVLPEVGYAITGQGAELSREKRQRAQRLQDMQMQIKAQGLENALQGITGNTPADQAQRTAIWQQLDALVPQTTQGPSLIQRVHKALHPKGTVAAGPQAPQTDKFAQMMGQMPQAPQKGEIKQTDDGSYVIIHPDGKTTPVIDAQGNPVAGKQTGKEEAPIPGVHPYKAQDGKYYMPLIKQDGTIVNQPMPEGYEPTQMQKVGSLGEFMMSEYGPNPTPEEQLRARSQWAASGAGTTTGTHVIGVPQPDNTIKYYQVTTTSAKSFPGAGGPPPQPYSPSGAAALPAAPATPTRPVLPRTAAPSTSKAAPAAAPSAQPPKTTAIPKLTGDVTGGRMTPEQKKQQELAGSAKRGLATLKALYSQDTPAANYDFLMTFIGLSYEAVRGARLNRAEIERAALTRTLPDELQNAYNLYIDKKVLTPAQKSDMLRAIQAIESTYHNWVYARDPQGKRHKSEAGPDGKPLTPLPQGWTLEGQGAATATQ
jgi:hypothetical protein